MWSIKYRQTNQPSLALLLSNKKSVIINYNENYSNCDFWFNFSISAFILEITMETLAHSLTVWSHVDKVFPITQITCSLWFAQVFLTHRTTVWFQILPITSHDSLFHQSCTILGNWLVSDVLIKFSISKYINKFILISLKNHWNQHLDRPVQF